MPCDNVLNLFNTITSFSSFLGQSKVDILCYLITQFPSLIYVPCDKFEQEYLAQKQADGQLKPVFPQAVIFHQNTVLKDFNLISKYFDNQYQYYHRTYGQGGLACCNSWGRKESDTTERLIGSDLTDNDSIPLYHCIILVKVSSIIEEITKNYRDIYYAYLV